MITKKSVFTLVIPDWSNKIKKGKVARKYYTKKDKLPLKHKGAKLKKIGRTFYYTSNGQKILKNTKTAGKEAYVRINGQKLYSGVMHWSERAFIVNHMHRVFIKEIKKTFDEPFPVFLGYTLKLKMEIYDVYTSTTPDIMNRWIEVKALEDAMVKAKILTEDSPEYRRSTCFEYIFVADEKDRKLVVTFSYAKNREA